MKPVSLCVHSYNEADALRRLVTSSLPLSDLVREWVIVDHRSDDDTQGVIRELRPICEARGVMLRDIYEGRDFQPGFLFADLRQMTYAACKAPVVWVLDADYILGPASRGLLEQACDVLTPPRSKYFGVAFSRPVVWDRLETDGDGVITDHGRVWLHAIHKGRVEILAGGAAKYRQVGKGGMWERPVPIARRRESYHVTPKRSIEGMEDVIVSANIKPRERIELRKTMTCYMREALEGKLRGPWLQEYEAGRVSQMKPYQYDDVDLRGWRLNLPNLALA